MIGKRVKFACAMMLAAMSLASCSSFTETGCSDEASKSALENAIRDGLEKVTIARAKDENGNSLIPASSIRASIAKIKLIIADIRTTKEDPDSTKRFCTGSLKIVFTPETFESAEAARELLGLSKISNAIDDAGLDKGADYLKGELDYAVQPTDDGSKVFAEFEGADGKLEIFGEVVAASLLRNRIENKVRVEKQEAEQARKQEEEAVQAMLTAEYEAAAAQRKASNEAIAVIWNSIDPDTRQQLLAQQKAWIKQKDAGCKVEGLQYSTEPTEQRTAEATCQARENNRRMDQLRGYISYNSGY
jgi:uncharacterized protein YecT (DUF1311 family)